MASSRIRSVVMRIILSIAAAVSLYVLLDSTLGLGASKRAAADLDKIEAAYSACEDSGKALPSVLLCLNDQKKIFWDVSEFLAAKYEADQPKGTLFFVRYNRLWATTYCAVAAQGTINCSLHGW